MTLPETQAERRTLAYAAVDAAIGRNGGEAAPSPLPPDNEYKGINEVAGAQSTPGIVTTSKGVVLRVRAIPNMMMAEARRKIKPPRVPMYFNKEKEAEEENPHHPDYIEAMQEYNIRVGTMGATAMLAFGTEVVTLPEDVLHVGANGWADDLKMVMDIDVPTEGKGRYAAWLRLYVLTDSDLTAVLDGVRRASGIVTEAEAQAAEDAFRDNKEPDAVEGVRPDTES